MKKGEVIEIFVDYNLYPNVGVGIVDGKRVRVKGALRGQRVRCRLSKKRGDRIEARLIDVAEPASDEQPSFCEHYEVCGGCMLQTFSAETQLAHKVDMVNRLFENAGLESRVTEAIESPEVFEYRNKMEFSFGDMEKGGAMTLGMHRKGHHHDVVTVDHCHLVDADYRLILERTLDFFTALEVPKYNKFSHGGILRHLVVRKAKATGEIMVALSATTQHTEDGKSIDRYLAGFLEMLLGLEPELSGKLTSIMQIKNDGLGDVVAGETVVLHGRDYIEEMLSGLRFKVTLYSFFQTNTLGAEKLYEAAIGRISEFEGKVCFDLFSGTGTIGQILASNGASHVVGVELVEDAVRSARENAAFNGLSNCEFIAGDVFKVLSGMDEALLPDVIVLDPPRAGVGENAVRKVASYGVEEIVYVSCNPKTLTEDLRIFEQLGYHAGDVTAVDMFPWAGHVETVVRLQRVIR